MNNMCEQCDSNDMRDELQVVSLVVKWTAEDIARKRPDWSVEQCEHFIDSSYQEIAAEAREAGDRLIDAILERMETDGQEAAN